jgi:sialate O-acetylesterase
LTATFCFADIRLAGVFSDHMVLQRDRDIPVWGTADPGEKVTVSFMSKQVGTVAAKDGRWMVRLGKTNAGGPFELTAAGKNTVTLTDVMVGEVWVCSGQSNMGWTIRLMRDIEPVIAAADYPDIRTLTVRTISAGEPQKDLSAGNTKWVRCNPETVLNFSAVAFFFGKTLHQELRVPIGLINSSWGGSVAEAWVRFEALKSDSRLRPLIADMDSLRTVSQAVKDDYNRKAGEWAKIPADKRDPAMWPGPARWQGARDFPTGLWNAMIHPLIPFGIRGAIWYQGEANAGRAEQYRTLFPALIKDWRKSWGQGQFPFLYVQLANYRAGSDTWAELREAQLMTLKTPQTAMAVTIDIGDPGNIHPNNKWDVGSRLALGALRIAYGRDIVYSGPVYRSMKREGNSIRLAFDHADAGLVCRGERLTGFTIAGKDQVFQAAEARIVGNSIVVSGADILNPVAVRYGWEDSPQCNLYNMAGLPASPFRTDSWPGKTRGITRP